MRGCPSRGGRDSAVPAHKLLARLHFARWSERLQTQLGTRVRDRLMSAFVRLFVPGCWWLVTRWGTKGFDKAGFGFKGPVGELKDELRRADADADVHRVEQGGIEGFDRAEGGGLEA